MNEKKRLAINLTAQMLAFAVNLGDRKSVV